MRFLHRCMLAAFALTMLLSLLTRSAMGSAAGAQISLSDGLSGTWQVSRICLTICLSPRPVLKVVRHWKDAVFMTSGRPPQILYPIGTQVLVHGPKDSLVLTLRSRGLLMSGSGVGADGSTFETTWRCVAPAVPAAVVPGAAGVHVAFTRPVQAPYAMGLC